MKMKKNYASPELELQENIDVITTSGEIDLTDEDKQVETQKSFFNF